MNDLHIYSLFLCVCSLLSPKKYIIESWSLFSCCCFFIRRLSMPFWINRRNCCVLHKRSRSRSSSTIHRHNLSNNNYQIYQLIFSFSSFICWTSFPNKCHSIENWIRRKQSNYIASFLFGSFLPCFCFWIFCKPSNLIHLSIRNVASLNMYVQSFSFFFFFHSQFVLWASSSDMIHTNTLNVYTAASSLLFRLFIFRVYFCIRLCLLCRSQAWFDLLSSHAKMKNSETNRHLEWWCKLKCEIDALQ